MNSNNDILFQRVQAAAGRAFKIDPATVTPQAAAGQLPGWDSLGHLNLMMEMEREFSIRFATDKISRPRNIGEICELVRELKPS